MRLGDNASVGRVCQDVHHGGARRLLLLWVCEPINVTPSTGFSQTFWSAPGANYVGEEDLVVSLVIECAALERLGERFFLHVENNVRLCGWQL